MRVSPHRDAPFERSITRDSGEGAVSEPAHAVCEANAPVRAVATAAATLTALALSSSLAGVATAGEPIAGYHGPGRVRAHTGAVTFGVVLEVVPGEWVRMLLPNGLERTYGWDEIDLVQVRGRPALGSAVPAPDSRSWLERTEGTAPHVPLSLPSDRIERRPRFPIDGLWSIALRGTVLSPTVRGGVFGLGVGGEANVVHHFAPGFGLYALAEHVRFDPSHLGGAHARTFMLGGGLRVGGDPTEPVSGLLDVATGWRVLSTSKHGSRGAIPFRIGAGVSLAPWRWARVDALVHVAPHVYPYAVPKPACDADGCEARTQQPYGFVGVSLSIHADV